MGPQQRQRRAPLPRRLELARHAEQSRSIAGLRHTRAQLAKQGQQVPVRVAAHPIRSGDLTWIRLARTPGESVRPVRFLEA
jgi:hypothetical protein